MLRNQMSWLILLVFVVGSMARGENVIPITSVMFDVIETRIVDLDGDDDLDFLLAGHDYNDTWHKSVSALERSGEYFIEHPLYEGSGVGAPHLLDMDGDGDLDIFTSTLSGDELVWFRNDNSFPFVQQTMPSPVTSDHRYLSPRDMDSDGDIDYAWYDWYPDGSDYTNEVHVFRAEVNGTYTDLIATIWTVTNPVVTFFADWHDLDADGFPDLVAVPSYQVGQYDFDYQATVYWNDQGDSFTDSWFMFSQEDNTTYYPALIDGDDLPDILLDYDNFTIPAQMQTAPREFTFTPLVDTYNCDPQLVLDYNMDGHADIAGHEGNQFKVWMNAGNQTFQAQDLCYQPSNSKLVGFADLDDDGDLDLVYSEYNPDPPNPGFSDLYVIQNSSTGGPTPLAEITLSTDQPLIVPPGSLFTYGAQLTSNLPNDVEADVWTMVTLPNGSEYGPVLLVNNLALPGGSTIQAENLTQAVPAFAPIGLYVFHMLAGRYPNLVADEDSFVFEVAGDAPSAAGLVADWEAGKTSTMQWINVDRTVSDAAATRAVQLSQTTPNPFNPTTVLTLQLPEASHVELVVYNIHGREVASLAREIVPAGTHRYTFDATNLASGLYFAHAVVPGRLDKTQKLMLVR